jgi:hypothetical protein
MAGVRRLQLGMNLESDSAAQAKNPCAWSSAPLESKNGTAFSHKKTPAGAGVFLERF